MNDSSHMPDQLIEEVIARRPFAPLPSGFVERIMAEIQDAQVAVTRQVIRYRLELFDVVVPILVACLVVLALGLTGQLAFLDIAIPIEWSAVFPTTNLSPPIEWAATNWMVLVGLFVFAEIGLGMLFCMWLWLDRPLGET
jgi:hypothetical protein